MADLFGSIASGVGSLVGGGSSGGSSTLAGIANLAGGAYSMYQGYQAQKQQENYLRSLYASQAKSDELLAAQAERSKQYFEPVENLQAEYALEDLKKMRDLQVAQQEYGIAQGQADIAYGRDTMDPARYALLDILNEGADAEKYRNIASTDVAQAFDKATGDTTRAYGRMGINPNSGAMQDFMNQANISEAIATAGARTEASRLSEDLDIQRRAQAQNLWAGIPLQTTASPVSGSAMSQQAAQGFQQAAQGLATGANLAGQQASQGYQGASAAFSNAANYLGSNSSAQNAYIGR